MSTPRRCHKCGQLNPGFLTSEEINKRVDKVIRFSFAEKAAGLAKRLWDRVRGRIES